MELKISLISLGTESTSTSFWGGSSTRGVVTFAAAPGVFTFVGPPLNNVSVVLTLELEVELFFKLVC